MALRLIADGRLTALSVRLDLDGRAPTVAADLVRHHDSGPEPMWQREDPVAAYGLNGAPPAPGALRLPAGLVDQVTATLAAGEVLWLRLVPPYGYLGAVPWERDLAPATLLRVPDRLPVAADPGQVWSAAVAIGAPVGSDWAAPYVEGLLDNLETHLPAARDVHVFADRVTANTLRVRGADDRPWVHLHEPQDAQRVSAERASRGVSQFHPEPGTRVVGPPPAGRIWADWIAAGVAGRAVRTLHVVLGADWDHDRPILTISPDPNEPVDLDRCASVSGDGVRLLADVLGASTLTLGSPPDNRADNATRLIADDLGRQRSGATLYSSIADDGHGEVLAAMYAFLAAGPGAAHLPWHRSLFAYLQPGQVGGGPDGRPEPVDPAVATVLPDAYRVPPAADLSDYYAAKDSVPSWVGTSERYVATELAALARPADAPAPTSTDKRAYEEGTAEALAEIQEIVARHARAE